jgi:hypothetical protein
MLSWIGEAERFIGTYPIAMEKVIELDVQNYMAQLPCDFFRFIKVEKERIPIRSYMGMDKKMISRRINIEKDFTMGDVYSIDNDYLYTNFNGIVELYYQALPVDDNGYPMVVNSIWHKEAVVAYLRFRVQDLSYIKDPTPANEKLMNREAMRWDKFKIKARGSDNTLNQDQMDSVGRFWNRIAHRPFHRDSDFRQTTMR